ncbi:membrane protein [Methanobrevibacter sp. YE315]|uniref:EamA family transporter n=1 Tax=Methanobrevibacter sp. YE315 TaxID=1609968 RepID=UPI000764D9AC|nr:EamA family transporter [Methanobrevibacter sp. YE315]AMD17176.1 membrane protein [Methanobrevibacter sp. YE315]
MWKLVWPILVVILSNTFYNICMKSMPSDVNPFGALMITYLVAAIISAIIFVYMVGPSNVGVEMSRINWTSVVLALAIVGLEIGYVFVYRAGWTVSTATVVANIGLACVLLLVGYFLYKENVSINQIVGIVVCMFGLVLINL